MNILLIGSGGREHAIAYALSKSESLDKLYAVPGNPGILKLAEKADLSVNDFEEVAVFCKKEDIDLVVVGPEQPLSEGIADVLISHGINVFGPSKYASQLESSKGFAKDFMNRYGIPTAGYKRFSIDERKNAHEYIDSGKMPVVIKADGLAAGKGVIISESYADAHSQLDLIFDGMFKDAGNMVVIEEFMEGEEASILAICDGTDFVMLAPAQDHKRVSDGDKGKNTGGMGAYAPAPVVNEAILNKVSEMIIKPALKGMASEKYPFIGCLYCGLMIKDNDIKVVEFNVRLGDPEAQAVLAVFEGDFAKLIYSASTGKIDKSAIKNIQKGYSCCVILASQGYPDSYKKGFPINGLNDVEKEDLIIFHAGTSIKDGIIVTDAGRVLGVTAIAASLKDAIEKAYQAVEKIQFDGKYFRKDIGFKGLRK